MTTRDVRELVNVAMCGHQMQYHQMTAPVIANSNVTSLQAVYTLTMAPNVDI